MRTLILLAAAISAASPAIAEPRTASVTVSSNDFRDAKARIALRHRVAMAIEEVCGSYANAFEWQVEEIDFCRSRAWRNAHAQMSELGGMQSVLSIVAIGRPAIHVSLIGRDLTRKDEISRVEAGIRSAARKVCSRAHAGALYFETTACVKTAIRIGKRKLDQLIERSLAGKPDAEASSISVSIPAQAKVEAAP